MFLIAKIYFYYVLLYCGELYLLYFRNYGIINNEES